MAVDRLERVNSLLRRTIAEALPKVLAGCTDIDAAAITVLDVSTAHNLRNATVTVSIFNHEGETGRYLHALSRSARELQQVINRECCMKYTPHLHFSISDSIAKGDRVLDILNHLDIPE
jgi:ribosome-binding factor A